MGKSLMLFGIWGWGWVCRERNTDRRRWLVYHWGLVMGSWGTSHVWRNRWVVIDWGSGVVMSGTGLGGWKRQRWVKDICSWRCTRGIHADRRTISVARGSHAAQQDSLIGGLGPYSRRPPKQTHESHWKQRSTWLYGYARDPPKRTYEYYGDNDS